MERNHICKKCGGIAGWDSYYQSWICTRCGDVERKPITNYDRLIRKTPEEMAEFMAANTDCYYCRAKDDAKCASLATTPCGEIWLDWLKQEATDAK